MFEGFTKETGEYLWELSFHNERSWFQEHKEQFERCLNRPFRDLAKDTAERLQALHPEMDVQCHVSRIYRDARRLYGRGPYKDHLWFTLKDGANYQEGPMFWFEVHAATYSYGLGFFDVTPAEMELFRKAIDAHPARFERLAAPIAARKEFRVIGPEYSRPKGSYDEPIRSWYNRKRVGAEVLKDLEGNAFSPELPNILIEAFERLMPMYQFLLQVHRAAVEAEPALSQRRGHGG